MRLQTPRYMAYHRVTHQLLLLLSLFELYSQKLTDYTHNKGVAGTKRKDTKMHN